MINKTENYGFPTNRSVNAALWQRSKQFSVIEKKNKIK